MDEDDDNDDDKEDDDTVWCRQAADIEKLSTGNVRRVCRPSAIQAEKRKHFGQAQAWCPRGIGQDIKAKVHGGSENASEHHGDVPPTRPGPVVINVCVVPSRCIQLG